MYLNSQFHKFILSALTSRKIKILFLNQRKFKILFCIKVQEITFEFLK
jgi:hypothetical protein